MKHLINSQDLTKEDYDKIFAQAEKFCQEGISPDLLPGKVISTLFFQPSTRTMNCFQTAMLKAGGGWIGVMGEKGLSMEKGESLADTVRTYGDYSDLVLLRHPDDDSGDIAKENCPVPVINGGSGSREHAVGAAFMLFNAYHYLKKLDGLKIGIYGTPGINRVCKAMIPIMGHYNIDLVVDDLGVSPVPEDVAKKAKENGLASLSYDKLDNFISDVDLLIVTRGLQKGIIKDFSKEKEEEILAKYKPITTEHMKKLRPDAYLEMILPLIFEIDRAVDSDPRAIYSKKAVHTELALAVIMHLLDENKN